MDAEFVLLVIRPDWDSKGKKPPVTMEDKYERVKTVL